MESNNHFQHPAPVTGSGQRSEPVSGSWQRQFVEAVGAAHDWSDHAASGQEARGELQPLAAAYERIRTMLDYQEERFIRRLAVRRILNRQILLEQRRSGVGQALMSELLRAQYLKPGSFPSLAAQTIDERLRPYLASLSSVLPKSTPPERIALQRRLLGIAAAEIEDILQAPHIEQVLLERLGAEIRSYDVSIDEVTSAKVALCAYLSADAELVCWRMEGTSETIIWQHFQSHPASTVSELLGLLEATEKLLRTEQFEATVRRFRRLVPPYRLLADLSNESSTYLERLLASPDQLRGSLRELASRRTTRSKARIRRSMLQATFYLFVTKVVVGLALEVPYDQVVAGHVVVLPLVINVLTPPGLMIAASIGIKPPSPANIERLVERTDRLLRDLDVPQLASVISQTAHQRGTQPLFWIFFGALYLVAFGGIVWLLQTLGFNLMSILVFLFFASVVGFFAFRIRANAKELAIERERESLFFLVVDFLSLPFLQVGRRLSLTVRQLNVVLFVMDFLIEAPFKLFLRAVEDWFTFLRQKRDELQ